VAKRIQEIEIYFKQDNNNSDSEPTLQRAHALRQNQNDINDTAALIVSADSDAALDQVDADMPF
jgi:hypothetical protein